MPRLHGLRLAAFDRVDLQLPCGAGAAELAGIAAVEWMERGACASIKSRA